MLRRCLLAGLVLSMWRTLRSGATGDKSRRSSSNIGYDRWRAGSCGCGTGVVRALLQDSFETFTKDRPHKFGNSLFVNFLLHAGRVCRNALVQLVLKFRLESEGVAGAQLAKQFIRNGLLVWWNVFH